MMRENSAVRSAQDLERKYDFGSIGEIKKNIELQKENLTKVENENTNILKAIIINLDGIIEDQSDISLWFFNGVPTLENEPYIDWTTYDNHIGDIYYDKDTGKVYIFKSENDAYFWDENTNLELMRAMALSNAEVKIGNERKVFLTIPTPPYQNGDWYIDKDNNLYICQITRDENEKYNENDFIIATKYTDDSYAIGLGENLKILSGSVANIIENVDKLDTTITNTNKLVDEHGAQIGILSSDSTQFLQTANEIEMTINDMRNNSYTKEEVDEKLTDGSVTMLKSTTVTINSDGQTVDKSGSPVKTNTDADGLSIIDKTGATEEILLEAKYDEELGETKVRAKNIIVEKYLVIGTHSRIEDYEDGTGIFYIG